MTKGIYTLISVVIISFVPLFGLVFLSRQSVTRKQGGLFFNNDKFKSLLPVLVSFATGSLFGDAFIHLLPESFERLGSGLSTSLSIILGLLFFFSLEKFVRWKHCHNLDLDGHSCKVGSLSTMILVGDSIHNFVDGILIGASYSISIPLGITTTFAVFCHEIPQEIGDFGVLIHSGYSVKKALFYNLLTALTAVLGAFIAIFLGAKTENFAIILLPFTAGGFIYIAGSDLIPELQSEVDLKSSIVQFISIIFGIAIMALLTLLE